MSTYKARTNSPLSLKLLSSTALTAASLAALAGPVQADQPSHSWANLDQQAGSFQTETADGNVTNITLDGNRAVGVGNADIYLDHTVNVDGALFAVRDNRADPTRILGNLNSNGQIIVIDANGVFFGQNSRVDVAGLIATTGDISNDALMNADQFEFSDFGDGGIRIETGASITVGEAGLAAFVSPFVHNSGVINAKLGTVAFAAGETVTVDLYGDGLVEIAAEGEVEEALLENSGSIIAEGGVVQMTASAAKGLVDDVINVEGVINVASVSQAGGKIILHGGDHGEVSVSGTLNAKGTQGGTVDIDGETVNLAADSNVDASANDALGEAGSITVWADHLNSHGSLAVLGQNGFIETSARLDGIINGGSVLLGENAEYLIDPTDACITDGSACTETGPALIVGASFIEGILNTAGANSGFTLTTAAATSEDGDIEVADSIDAVTTNSGVFLRLEAHDDIQVNANIADTGLGLTVQLIGDFDGSGAHGDVDIDADISTNGGDFLASAARDIEVNGTVTTSGGNATLEARGTGQDESDLFFTAAGSLSTAGGNVDIQADQIDLAAGSSIDAGAGEVFIDRATGGDISLGDVDYGGLHLTEAELDAITAGSLSIGDDNTTEMYVDGVDVSDTISGLTTLTTKFETGTDEIVGSDHINFIGNSTFNALNVVANDHIIFADGAKVETLIGDAAFGGDINNLSLGDYIMGENAQLDTNGHNVTINVLNVDLQDDAKIETEGGNVHITTAHFEDGDANGKVTLATDAFIDTKDGAAIGEQGGDIIINNAGIFESADANSIRTTNTGEISINQWEGGSIQNAIDAVDNTGTGTNTINIGPGTFNENVSVYEDNFTLIGDGTDATTIIDGTGLGGNGITVTADNTSLNGMIVQNFVNGIAVDAEINTLSMTDILSRMNSYAGFHVSNTAGIDGLIVDDSHFDDNNVQIGGTNDWGYGWYFAKGDNDPANTTTVTNVTVTNTTFSGNAQKGIYAEKLDNASFTNVDVIDSGVWADSVYGNAGIDINLKNGTYANISFDDLTVTGSGLNSATRDGSAVIIKARNDGATYGATPASLSNVTITNSNITAGGEGALAFGNNIDGGSVTDSTITGPEAVTIYGGATNLTIGGELGVTGNTINGGTYGVGIFDSAGNTVKGNFISSDGDGVAVVNSDNTVIGGPATLSDANVIDGGLNGVAVENSDNVTIQHNAIGLASENGIIVTNSAMTHINENLIGLVGQDAIHVEGGFATQIDGNIVGLTGDDGIEVVDSFYNVIDDNVVVGALDDGINVSGGNYTAITNNDVLLTGGEGIDVSNQTGITAETLPVDYVFLGGDNSVYIADNEVALTGGNGIKTLNTGKTTINDNDVLGTGIDYASFIPALISGGAIDAGVVTLPSTDASGILVENADSLAMDSNVVVFTGGHGIEVQGAGTTDITNNTVGFTGIDSVDFNLAGFADNFSTNFNDDIGEVLGAAWDVVINDAPMMPFLADIIPLPSDIEFDEEGGDGMNVGGITGDLAITGNDIGFVNEDGIEVGEAGNVLIDDNVVIFTGDNGILFSATEVNGDAVTITENGIYAEGNGIHFNTQINGGSTVTIAENTIDAGDDGIDIEGPISGAETTVTIGGASDLDGNSITGGNDGIDIGAIDAATVKINHNTEIVGDDDGIEFEGALSNGATVEVIGNDDIIAGDDGIDFQSTITASTVTISGNNHGIHAGDHGISFDANIGGNSTINIHDNIIQANENESDEGAGIFFDGTVRHASVNIGDGNLYSSKSNVISVKGNVGPGDQNDLDGIRFDKTVGNGAKILIDGNRIGYTTESLQDPASVAAIADDGIAFAEISGSASVKITDNHIQANDDGVDVSGIIANSATVTIGAIPGDLGGNVITAADNGIVFNSAIQNRALLNINHNTIDAEGNGILFQGPTSNARTFNDQEIRIAHNTIDGGLNGISFEGQASGKKHDIKITHNTITGETENGVSHSGGIAGSVLKIVDNTSIIGQTNGVSITGDFVTSGDKNARIFVNRNDYVQGVTGNGVLIQDAVEGGASATVNSNTIQDVGLDGIGIHGVDIVVAHGNTITNAGRDGINISDFNSAWVTDNVISNTGDDGIELLNGGFAFVYLNNIFGAGFNDEGGSYGYDADGIRAHNVGGGETGYADADLKIIDNTIAFTIDDGIEVTEGNRTYIADNTLGHIGYEPDEDTDDEKRVRRRPNWSGADGIRVVDTNHTVIKRNGIADVLDDGIRVKNGSYVGIFDNKVLLVGDEGIEVSGIYPDGELGPDVLLADPEYPTTGYAVNIEGNEVVLTGDHGIYVRDSDSVRIVNNDVLMTGVGQDLIKDEVNRVAAIVAGDAIPAFAPAPSLTDGDFEYEPYFSFGWGNGDGIKVDNIHRNTENNQNTKTIEGPTPYPYDGEWTVLIQGNDVSWTGGDGIEVSNSGETLIGGYEEGEENTVKQAGIDWTEISGSNSFSEWVNTGPFTDEEARRVVWEGQDMTNAVGEYLTTGIDYVDHDTHDGIRVTNVYNSGYTSPLLAGSIENNFYGYAVNIIGNTVDISGDDGIEVSYSESVLIDGNTVSNSGYGREEYYGSGDEYGADGITVMDIYGGEYGPGQVVDGDVTEYSVVIRENTVDTSADDGIEVVSVAGNVLVDTNTVSNSGQEGHEGYYDDGHGADGIHVRNVYARERYVDSVEQYVYLPDSHVEILGNTVDTSGDDGVEVAYVEGYTTIDGNDISNSGYGDGGYYGGSDIYGYGSDGIHVRNVTGGEYAITTSPEYSLHIQKTDTPAVTISNNTSVDTSADDGIQVLWSGDTVIDNNNVNNSGFGDGQDYEYGQDEWGADGIHVLGHVQAVYTGEPIIISGPDASITDSGKLPTVPTGPTTGPVVFLSHPAPNPSVEITNNTVANSADDGVEVEGATNILVDTNDISNSGDDGITLVGYNGEIDKPFIPSFLRTEGKSVLSELSFEPPEFNAIVNNNDVTNSGTDGIQVDGFDNAIITNNDVIDSGANGLYVSGPYNGEVEVSGNTIINPIAPLGTTSGANGMHFESGNIDLTGPGNRIVGGRTGLRFAATGPLSLVDDNPADIFEGTIGEQTFENQSQYFVEVAGDGTLFGPGPGPYIWNAQNSSYTVGSTTIQPSTTGGVLTQAQFDLLESMFFHFPDGQGIGEDLGLFFFGRVGEDAIDNLEDILKQFDNPLGNFSGLNVTIVNNPARLAGLNPQAGGTNPEDIEPAAGDEGQNPEDIEPAAGGEEVDCWSDAVGSSSDVVNYSFGGSFEESLSDAAGCSTGTL